jgi:hypothetical protein
MAISGLPSHINQFLDTTGDGTGTIGATGDWSLSSEEFIYQVPSGKIAEIQRMIICIGDDTQVGTDKYGGATALTNGITIKLTKSDGTLIQFLNNGGLHPIKTSADWAKLCYDFKIYDTGTGQNTDYALYRWTFSRAGMPLVLSDGDKLVVTLNDNFTPLTDHRFLVEGLQFYENKSEINRIRNDRYN